MARRGKLGVASTVLFVIYFAATLFIALVVPLKLRVFSNGSTTKCLLDSSETALIDFGASFCSVLVWFVVGTSVMYTLASLVTGCLPMPLFLSRSILLLNDVVLACAWFVMFVLIVQKSNAATAAGIGAKSVRSSVALAAVLAALAIALDAAILVYSIVAERRQKTRSEPAPEAI
jgi:hypothetical protein